MREVHDHYFHEAKREGYRSRAAYKLIEIDERRGIFTGGDFVLDCGSAPGSWLQVAARRVGPRGCVVGIDLKPIERGFREDTVITIQGDLRQLTLDDLREHGVTRPFNVILSDMAPGTTGDPRRDHYRSAQLCEAVLERCPAMLRPGGHLVMKVFEGEQYPLLLKRCGTMFEKCKGFKPKASRSESVEMYIVAQDHRAVSKNEEPEEESPDPPARPRPRGWA